MELVKIKISNIIPYEKNARKNDKAVDIVKKSIEQCEYVAPIIIDENNVILAGHTRLKALKKLKYKEVECVVKAGLTQEQKKKYRLLDNKTNEIAEWDLELLEQELQDLDFTGFDLDWGIDNLEEKVEIKEDDYEEPDNLETKVKLGEVWQLGRHRLMCGDSTDKATVEKLMDGNKADLVFTDPPYGMKKEADGVLNDNLNYDKLLEFNKQWIPHTFDALKDNGSWYCWGIDEPLMDIYSNILKPMIKENKITFRNLLTWNKSYLKNGNTFNPFGASGSDNLRSYSTADEKCLFVMCGVQGFNNNSDNYFEKWEPIRVYLENEAKKVGLNNKKLKEICGVEMYGHWFTKSQWGLITEEHYLKLQNYFKKEYGAFKKEYDELKKEYDELKKEYNKTRAYFKNEDESNNVWNIEITKGEERENTGGHATPKPIALCGRAIKSSSRENEIVLDVFGGSGSTLIACEQLNRICYMMELSEHYCDVIIDRWEKFTGLKAEKI